MHQTFACVLLLLSSSVALSKYVYIKKRVTWHEAQMYCRLFYTDLAPVSNQHDTRLLKKLAGDTSEFIWIGMLRDPADSQKWMWSGGGEVSTFFWEQGQPGNTANEDYGVIFKYKWHDSTAAYMDPFFCYNAIVVRERKTWEEALLHCREHHRDLASVGSETEMMLIQKELEENHIAGHVWIGLHFFPGQWLWVDRQPMEYEAWGQGGKPECPDVKLECAALQVQSSNRTAPTLVTNANITARPALNLSDAAAAGKESGWEARDCEERLHFICY